MEGYPQKQFSWDHRLAHFLLSTFYAVGMLYRLVYDFLQTKFKIQRQQSSKNASFNLKKCNKKRVNHTTAMLWDKEACADSSVLKTTYA